MSLGWKFVVVALAVLPIGRDATAQVRFHERHSRPSAGALRGFASNGGLMIAVGDGGRILTSSDGTAWTTRISGTAATLSGAAHGGGRFVAVGERGVIVCSDDGVDWRASSDSGTADHLYGVTYGKGRFVAAGDYGVVMTSLDGDTWTESPRFILTPLRAVAYGQGVFVAAGSTGVVWRSWDGIPWSNGFPPRGGDIEALAASPAGFLAVGDSEIPLRGGTSSSSFAWFSGSPIPTAGARMYGASMGAGYSVVCGEKGNLLMAGTSGTNWTAPDVTPPSPKIDLRAVGFANDTFIVLGDGETILQSDPVFARALQNISVRAAVGPGERTLIGGFCVRGRQAKLVLLRAAGPSLATFGIATPLTRPKLSLCDGAGTELFSNRGWTTSAKPEALRAASQRAGAFAFPEGSADSAIVAELPPGIYTAQVTAEGETGVALLECYDLDSAPGLQSRIVNLSSRAFAGPDEEGGIRPGLTVTGGVQTLLVRAIGPGLGAFGVANPLADPRFRVIYPGLPAGIHWAATPPNPGPWYDTWHVSLDYAHAFTPDDIRGAATRLGAFPLTEGGRDAAGLITLSSGSFSIEVGTAAGSSGVVLVEIYDTSY